MLRFTLAKSPRNLVVALAKSCRSSSVALDAELFRHDTISNS